MSENEVDLDKVIEKHCEFWQKTNEQAVLQQVPFVKWSKKPFPVHGGSITDPKEILPGDVDIVRFLGLELPIPQLHYGNKVNCIMPLFPQAWMSAIIGCKICASDVSLSALGAHYDDIECVADDFIIRTALESEWYELLQECTDAIVSKADGRIGTSQFHFRGVVDMLAAYFKEDVLCLAVYDYPEQIKKLAGKFADLYIATAKSDIAKRGLWKGGSASSWGIYAPGELLNYQADASNLLSAQMYEDLILEFDAKIIKEFEYSLLHTHYTGLHVIESLVKIKELKCIQINLDREAVPDWKLDRVIDACKTVQENGKCVLINGELCEREVSEMLERLEPQGLMMFYWLPEDWDPLDIV